MHDRVVPNNIFGCDLSPSLQAVIVRAGSRDLRGMEALTDNSLVLPCGHIEKNPKCWMIQHPDTLDRPVLDSVMFQVVVTQALRSAMWTFPWIRVFAINFVARLEAVVTSVADDTTCKNGIIHPSDHADCVGPRVSLKAGCHHTH
eukprot:Protomagalhaensia_sp_Gyna_25__5301@NODE_661_length_2895_cov_19_228641_g516_i0_p2_GENE_NODE_661_length_2895_cov_19_228641_g516_i0NODE_661_length_2895_cov_19_228641_g516_i0_p2_ORF_typecomplete_len145_score7_95Plasmod_Pvs28/PF06247_11/0_24_NODE_661_length_2895_cov_19_228641_g516_i0347781